MKIVHALACDRLGNQSLHLKHWLWRENVEGKINTQAQISCLQPGVRIGNDVSPGVRVVRLGTTGVRRFER